MFELKKRINGINFDVSFNDKVNLIRGNSGTGKTFLFRVISDYCVNNRIPCAYVDYKIISNSDKDFILNYCKNKDIIILDNADLYLDNILLKMLKSLRGTIVLSKKSSYGLDSIDMNLYTVSYDGKDLKTKRVMI